MQNEVQTRPLTPLFFSCEKFKVHPEGHAMKSGPVVLLDGL